MARSVRVRTHGSAPVRSAAAAGTAAVGRVATGTVAAGRVVAGGIDRRVRPNVWLARHAADLHTVMVMKARDGGGGTAAVHLRGVSPLRVRHETTDVDTAWELFYHGEYDSLYPWTARSIVDLGANVGMFLAYALSRGDHLEHYVGVEADGGNFAALTAQVAHLDTDARTELFHAAAWAETGTVRFADAGPEWGRAVVDRGGVEVEALTVEAILDRAGLDSCDLLKMDIEGGESSVLPTIDRWAHRVEVLTVELHGQPDDWLSAIVSAAGYRPLPRGVYFRHHPAAVREDVVGRWLR